MTTETNTPVMKVLRHFLANEGKPVAEALRRELQNCMDGPYFVHDAWRDDRWRAAWREMCEATTRGMVLREDGCAAGYDGLPIFCACGENLFGDDLANALRDLALEGL